MKSLNQYITEFVVNKHITSTQPVVDLGLPSGLKWSTCNIGAEKPEDYGLLFQWGRVDGYKYDDKNHKFLSKESYTTTSEKQYKVSDILDKSDDAAYQATKGELRMPTEEEIDELIEHTTNEWTKLNGVKGRKFISKKDKSNWIFIPAAGSYIAAGSFPGANGSFRNAGFYGYLWGASADDDFAGSLSFNSADCYFNAKYIYYGQAVRGVCK